MKMCPKCCEVYEDDYETCPVCECLLEDNS